VTANTSDTANNTANAGSQNWADLIDERLGHIREQGRWREYRELDLFGPRGHRVSRFGARLPALSFASNDYLGLSTHPELRAAAKDAIDRWGTGTGASRLVTGNRPVHLQLEAAIANWKSTQAAVVFPTGFAANLGVLTALGTADVTIVSDSLNHASIIDGARLSRADVEVVSHGDFAALEQAVQQAHGPVLVVTDTVFSMDGDALDVQAVATVCRRHGAALVLDEAHGVLGPNPTNEDLGGIEVVRVGTLSKALGSLGGFVACSQRVADLLVNTARSSIFTTGLSPADSAAALAAVNIVNSPEGDELRSTLRKHVDRLRPGHPSPIIPIILGGETEAVRAADRLLEQGLVVPAIRPPTVAPGTSRLRVTLSAAHTEAEVDRLLVAFDALGIRP